MVLKGAPILPLGHIRPPILPLGAIPPAAPPPPLPPLLPILPLPATPRRRRRKRGPPSSILPLIIPTSTPRKQPPPPTVSDESEEDDSDYECSSDLGDSSSRESDPGFELDDLDESLLAKPHTGGGPKHDIATRVQALTLFEYGVPI
jgi:hypothetical protein